MRTVTLDTQQRTIKHNFSILEYLYWGSLCTLAFNVLFLQQCGFDSVQIGTIMAVNNVLGMLSPIVWGYAADRLQSQKRVFLISAAFTATSTVLLPLTMHTRVLGIPLTVPLLGLFMVSYSGSYSLLDGWLVSVVSQHTGKLHYANIRLWGAIGYSSISVLLTFVVRNTQIGVAYYAAAALGLFVLLWAQRQTETGAKLHRPKTREGIRPWILLKNPLFLSMLLLSFGIHFSINASTTFLPYLMDEVGLDKSLFSAVSGLRGLAEVPMLLLGASLLRTVIPSKALSISAILLLIELLCYCVIGAMWQVIALQAVAGLAYGLYLCIAPQYAQQLAPEHLAASAQSMRVTMVFAGNIAASLLGGWIIKQQGAAMLYIIVGIILFLITLVFIASSIVTAKKTKDI
ncbi:MFS transporter [Eubacteriales bacterium OttesenSCG-928-N14]|nr:MFS transporter [Eubacteriales bacterium OttesenSCG-928-N14]